MLKVKVNPRKRRISAIKQYAVLILIALIFIFPILFMLMSSFKSDDQLLRDSASLRAFLPVGNISLQNYIQAITRVPTLRFLFNSTLVTTTTVIFGLIVNSMAAFSFSFLRWKGKGIILTIIIATFIIPFETIAIPLLLIVNKLPWLGLEGFTVGWLNSYHVQIIPFIAHSFQIFLFYQFFTEIPHDLIEASRIDGAHWFQIYLKIVMPVSGPVLATASILRFLDMWNQYLWPLMVIQSEKFRPVMVGVKYFYQLDIAWGQIMAYLSLITIPVLIFYLVLQKSFIESIASTGIKG